MKSVLHVTNAPHVKSVLHAKSAHLAKNVPHAKSAHLAKNVLHAKSAPRVRSVHLAKNASLAHRAKSASHARPNKPPSRLPSSPRSNCRTKSCCRTSRKAPMTSVRVVAPVASAAAATVVSASAMPMAS